MANFLEMMNSERPIKIQLDKEMTLEEIYEKMNARASDFRLPFKLKKGLLGKKIEFEKDKDLELVVNVTVKGKEVTVRPVIHQNKTAVGTGNVQIRIDKNSMFRKGVKGVLNMPAERGKFVAETAETIRKILT